MLLVAALTLFTVPVYAEDERVVIVKAPERAENSAMVPIKVLVRRLHGREAPHVVRISLHYQGSDEILADFIPPQHAHSVVMQARLNIPFPPCKNHREETVVAEVEWSDGVHSQGQADTRIAQSSNSLEIPCTEL